MRKSLGQDLLRLKERQGRIMSESIKNLPETQRPYEKCLREGVGALSDSELLAVILRSGTMGKNSISLSSQILKTMENASYPGNCRYKYIYS